MKTCIGTGNDCICFCTTSMVFFNIRKILNLMFLLVKVLGCLFGYNLVFVLCKSFSAHYHAYP